jgi:glycosyltransferase involved in cell wall biosynthesis
MPLESSSVTLASTPVPSVSVVITCRDLGEFLGEAVASVRAQTFTDHEIVVVDDASSDPATLEALRALPAPGLRVLRSDENLGLPGARNLGIQSVSGRYVCCLDADDLLEPTWFERAVAVLEDRPDVAFVTHWLRAFGDQEWDWTPQRCDLVTLLDANSVNGAALVRRGVLLELGMFDAEMRSGCEDWDLWIRALRHGHRGWIVPEFMFRYRRRPDSMSRRMDHAALFRGLLEKHAPEYRRHLLDLLQRRELGISDLERRIFDLEALHHGDRLQRRARLQAELDALEAKADRVRETEREAESRRALEAALESEREQRAGEVATALAREQALGRQLVEQRAVLDAERGANRELRASWSWRVTAPGRRLLDRIRNARG